MVSDLLSQDEINALLAQTGKSDASEPEKTEAPQNSEGLSESYESLKEKVFSKFSDSFKNILSELLGGELNSELTDIYEIEFNALKEKIKGKKIVFDSKFLDSFKGKFSIFFDYELFSVIAALMNGEEENVPDNLSEMYISAINEAANQCISSGMTDISRANKGMPVSIDIPEVKETDVTDEYANDNIGDGTLVVAEYKMSYGSYTDKQIFFAMKKETADSIKNAVDKKEEPVSQAEKPKETPKKQEIPQAQVQKEEHLNAEEIDERNKKILMLLDVPIKISVSLGKNRMLVKDIINLGIGSILELDKSSSEPVDLVINNKPVARGDVVVVDENFGLRITELVTPYERLNILKKK